MSEPPVLGVVIPTLNEAAHLPRLLRDLRAVPLPHKVVVVDGGSTDGTCELARRAGAEVTRTVAGRPHQMNVGAAALDAPWLLFLHADSRLSEVAGHALGNWLENADPTDVGVFRFGLEGADWFWRFIEIGQRLRQRLYGLAYGDQGLLVSREHFTSVGGFPDQPLLEDVEILKRLKKTGRFRPLRATLWTSPRRYEKDGRWLGWLRNAATIGLYQVGVPARLLSRWYGSPQALLEESSTPRQELLVFAKAPRPGTVKTRLARDVGDERAAEIYRRMGEGIVQAVQGGPYEVTVCFDPPDARGDVKSWLGAAADAGRLSFRPQARGDLGARLTEAVDQALGNADRVCVIGTDAPAVDAALVTEAFAALGSTDCVLGPATDGGYYLIGLARPHTELFRDIPWSTPDVHARTLERAEAAGLTVHLLPTLSDVDVIDDLPVALR